MHFNILNLNARKHSVHPYTCYLTHVTFFSSTGGPRSPARVALTHERYQMGTRARGSSKVPVAVRLIRLLCTVMIRITNILCCCQHKSFCMVQKYLWRTRQI